MRIIGKKMWIMRYQHKTERGGGGGLDFNTDTWVDNPTLCKIVLWSQSRYLTPLPKWPANIIWKHLLFHFSVQHRLPNIRQTALILHLRDCDILKNTIFWIFIILSNVEKRLNEKYWCIALNQVISFSLVGFMSMHVRKEYPGNVDIWIEEGSFDRKAWSNPFFENPVSF